MINCVDNTFSHAIIIHYFSSVSAGRFLILYELAGYYNNHKSLYIFYLLEPPNVYTPYKKYSRNYYNFLAQFSLSLLLLHFFSSTTTTTHSYTIFILFYRTDYFFLFFFFKRRRNFFSLLSFPFNFSFDSVSMKLFWILRFSLHSHEFFVNFL